jgi:endoglucanase
VKKKQVKLLKQILETPSPTGFEERLAAKLRAHLADTADEIATDSMGSVHATLFGHMTAQNTKGLEGCVAPERREVVTGGTPSNAQAPSCMLSTHMDEIGLMVTYISDDGYLSVAALGGVDAAILPGLRVDVHTQRGVLRGVVGRKPIHLIAADERKSVTPIDKLVIDLGLPAKAVKRAVRVGDPITFGVGFERLGKHMATSRAFDDKVGVFIATQVLARLKARGVHAGQFTAAITVQEEIGTRGAITSAHSVNPQVALAFDVTHATDYPGIDKTKYGKIVCGQGPVIARGPNINPVVFEKLVAAAEAEKIPYQIEAEPSVTGTDARSIQVTRGGIPTGLVSVPLRYMHTPTEMVDLRDVEHAVALIVRFVESLSAHDCFVPGLGGTASEADLQEENNAVQAEAQVTPSPNETANARAEGSL